jgi:hypothetical protein
MEHELFPILSSIGVPTVVECVLPITDAAGFQISSLAEQLIQYSIERHMEEEEPSIRAEMYVRYDVPSERILDVWTKKISFSTDPDL